LFPVELFPGLLPIDGPWLVEDGEGRLGEDFTLPPLTVGFIPPELPPDGFEGMDR
jgi:hypothetical protein